MNTKNLKTIWIADELWQKLELILGECGPPSSIGRKRIDARSALDAIIFRLGSGCQWNQLPNEFPDDSSVHRTFQRWEQNGVLDQILLEATLKAAIIDRSNPQQVEQHLCLDKGYDHPTGRDAVNQHKYTPPIRRLGEEKLDEQQEKRYPARRWVVERTLSWLSKCRAILVRY